MVSRRCVCGRGSFRAVDEFTTDPIRILIRSESVMKFNS